MMYHVISQDMYTPLHYAVKEGHLAVIETLTKSGARVNSIGKVIVNDLICKLVLSITIIIILLPAGAYLGGSRNSFSNFNLLVGLQPKLLPIIV